MKIFSKKTPGKLLAEFDEGDANFDGANFSGAYLGRAYFGRANLAGAVFSGANFSGANLSGANFNGAIGLKIDGIERVHGVKYKNLREIDELQELHEIKLREWLISRGWKYTSDNPSSIWLYVKDVEGKTVMVSAAIARVFEENIAHSLVVDTI